MLTSHRTLAFAAKGWTPVGRACDRDVRSWASALRCPRNERRSPGNELRSRANERRAPLPFERTLTNERRARAPFLGVAAPFARWRDLYARSPVPSHRCPAPFARMLVNEPRVREAFRRVAAPFARSRDLFAYSLVPSHRCPAPFAKVLVNEPRATRRNTSDRCRPAPPAIRSLCRKGRPAHRSHPRQGVRDCSLLQAFPRRRSRGRHSGGNARPAVCHDRSEGACGPPDTEPLRAAHATLRGRMNPRMTIEVVSPADSYRESFLCGLAACAGSKEPRSCKQGRRAGCRQSRHEEMAPPRRRSIVLARTEGLAPQYSPAAPSNDAHATHLVSRCVPRRGAGLLLERLGAKPRHLLRRLGAVRSRRPGVLLRELVDVGLRLRG